MIEVELQVNLKSATASFKSTYKAMSDMEDLGQLENTETRERKREREREREGTPKTEVTIFDRAAHDKAIVF